MNKKQFFSLFIVTHIIFIFLLIYRHTLYVRTSFMLQKNERLLAKIQQQTQEYTNQLYELQNHETIKQFAEKTLHLKPIVLSQVQKMSNHENNDQ